MPISKKGGIYVDKTAYFHRLVSNEMNNFLFLARPLSCERAASVKEPFILGQATSLDKIRPRAGLGKAARSLRKGLQIRLARNEYESAQILVASSTGEILRNVRLEVAVEPELKYGRSDTKVRRITIPKDAFPAYWADVRSVASEVKRFESILLSGGPPPAFSSDVPQSKFPVRLFAEGGKVWLVAANATDCSIKAKVRTGSCERAELLSGDPASISASGEKVEIELPKWGFVFLRIK